MIAIGIPLVQSRVAAGLWADDSRLSLFGVTGQLEKARCAT